LVVPLLQEALRALTAGYIGARIGAGTTGTARTIRIATRTERISRITTLDTDTGRIGRWLDPDTRPTGRGLDRGTRISPPTAMAITSNPIMGMATGRGGSSDHVISIIGEVPLAGDRWFG